MPRNLLAWPVNHPCRDLKSSSRLGWDPVYCRLPECLVSRPRENDVRFVNANADANLSAMFHEPGGQVVRMVQVGGYDEKFKGIRALFFDLRRLLTVRRKVHVAR